MTMICLTWSGVRFGLRSSNSATAPETMPVDMDVPLKRMYLLPFLAVTT